MTDSSSGAGRGGPGAFDPKTPPPTAPLPTAGPPTAPLPTAGPPTAPLPTAGPPTAGPPAAEPPTAERAGRRRPPLWVFIAAAVALVGALVVVFVLQQRPTAEPEADATVQEQPEDVVVTLPPPTPTIEPVVREPGTAFYDALPGTVLSYAMTEAVEDPTFGGGAVEAYRATYSDGGTTQLTAVAGQWATPEAAGALLDSVIASQPAEAEQGAVTVDGTDVGRFVLVERADGTGSIWWTNTTVLIQLDGPAEVLRDFFAAFPL